MKTWGEMSKEEKINIFSAWLDGEEIEAFVYRYQNDELVEIWGKTNCKLFRDEVPVRVKVKQ